ncbi:MAG: hypothetical protein HC905_04120 [Bacteroidales bacterium]|nr:hypothetical protein [Bacteroidales bacterium]
MDGTMYIDAPVSNIIRSNGKAGKVAVNVTSKGLKPASVMVEFVNPVQKPVQGIYEPALKNRKSKKQEKKYVHFSTDETPEIKLTQNDLLVKYNSRQELLKNSDI